MSKESAFLLLAAVGLVPIALSYGLMPVESMSFLYAINVDSVELSHIFRAVMGLYLAMVVFWLVGAYKKSLRPQALWSLTIFMLGLAAGRTLSLLVDGMPHPLLLAYLLLEIGFGAVGYVLASRYHPVHEPYPSSRL